MSQLGYDLLRSSKPQTQQHIDPVAPVSTLHRIATVACEKIILLMNNTMLLTEHHRLSNMKEAGTKFIVN